MDLDLQESIVFDWDDFLYANRYGNVKVEKGACSQWELVRGIIDDHLLEHLMKDHKFN